MASTGRKEKERRGEKQRGRGGDVISEPSERATNCISHFSAREGAIADPRRNVHKLYNFDIRRGDVRGERGNEGGRERERERDTSDLAISASRVTQGDARILLQTFLHGYDNNNNNNNRKLFLLL